MTNWPRSGERAACPRNRWWRSLLACATLSLAAGVVLPAAAQFEGVPQIASEGEMVIDPPGRAGRLAEVQGSAWLFHPEAGEWLAAQRNRPLTSGDRLATDANGRIDLRIGSTSLRIDGNTELELVRLDDQQIEVYLHSGSLAARLRSNEAARELVLSTDDGRFTPQGVGSYRLDRPAGLSQLTVWSGQALYEGPHSALTVRAGQRAEFWLDANQRAQYSLGAPLRDGFAAWANEVDRSDPAGVASRYVSPEMTGIEDLDRYGRWEQDPEHGALWLPREVPIGWAPYAAGHWAWVSPWGWSWVDDAPWGFAPFHYGRWVWARNNWCWAPGRYVSRPVYAPALVGWVGGAGAGLSVAIGGGPAVAWFALAPREAYVPHYRVSPRYVRTVNGPHFRNGGDIDRLIRGPSTAWRGIEYRNRKFLPGMSAVPLSAFEQRGRREPVSPQWRGASVAREFERLPATPVTVLPRPDGLRPGGPALRSPVDRPPSWRDGRPDGRFDGRPDARERRDGHEGRDAGDGRYGRTGPIAPPAIDARGARDPRGEPARGPREPAPPAVTPAPAAMPGQPPLQPVPALPRERAGERPGERPGDAAPGHARPGQPNVGAPEQRSPAVQPAPPAAAPGPGPAPAGPRNDVPAVDPRLNQPERPDRGGDRPAERPARSDRKDRPERPERGPDRPAERMAPAPQTLSEAPRMAPAPARAAPPPVFAAPPAALPVRPAPPPAVVAPSYTGPLQSRDPREAPREARDPRELRTEPGQGRRPM